jgi:hypothetical protein
LWKLPLPIVNGTIGGIAYVSKTYDSPWRVATLVQAADGKSSIILLGTTHPLRRPKKVSASSQKELLAMLLVRTLKIRPKR